MDKPKFLTALQGYAIVVGAGGVAALQAMKMELFVLPADARLFLSYFFSIVSILCVFLSGSSLLKIIKEGRDVLDSLKQEKKQEEEKTERQNEADKKL